MPTPIVTLNIVVVNKFKDIPVIPRKANKNNVVINIGNIANMLGSSFRRLIIQDIKTRLNAKNKLVLSYTIFLFNEIRLKGCTLSLLDLKIIKFIYSVDNA